MFFSIIYFQITCADVDQPPEPFGLEIIPLTLKLLSVCFCATIRDGELGVTEQNVAAHRREV